MYYLERDVLNDKLHQLRELTNHLEYIHTIPSATWTSIHGFAQERMLHLTMELVTDVGHMLIDCFMMRDAGSYEDIIVILHEEQVFADTLLETLIDLVKLRTVLVKTSEHRLSLQPHFHLNRFIAAIPQFCQSVEQFVEREFQKIQ